MTYVLNGLIVTGLLRVMGENLEQPSYSLSFWCLPYIDDP